MRAIEGVSILILGQLLVLQRTLCDNLDGTALSPLPAQLHQVKLVVTGKNPYTARATFNSATPESRLRDVGLQTKNVGTICYYGMWVLYNKINYGSGFESSTIITALQSTEYPPVCGKPSGLNSVQSMRWLGNVNPNSDGVDLFTGINFLGNLTKLDATDTNFVDNSTTGFKLGSIAITGSNKWLVCGDNECSSPTTVCIDMKSQRGGKLFMLTNIAADKNTNWPQIVKRVKTLAESDGDCESYSNPSPPTPTNLEINN